MESSMNFKIGNYSFSHRIYNLILRDKVYKITLLEQNYTDNPCAADATFCEVEVDGKKYTNLSDMTGGYNLAYLISNHISYSKWLDSGANSRYGVHSKMELQIDHETDGSLSKLVFRFNYRQYVFTFAETIFY